MGDELRDALDLVDATLFSTRALCAQVRQLLEEVAGVDALATVSLEVVLARSRYAARDLERIAAELRELAAGGG